MQVSDFMIKKNKEGIKRKSKNKSYGIKKSNMD